MTCHAIVCSLFVFIAFCFSHLKPTTLFVSRGKRLSFFLGRYFVTCGKAHRPTHDVPGELSLIAWAKSDFADSFIAPVAAGLLGGCLLLFSSRSDDCTWSEIYYGTAIVPQATNQRWLLRPSPVPLGRLYSSGDSMWGNKKFQVL